MCGIFQWEKGHKFEGANQGCLCVPGVEWGLKLVMDEAPQPGTPWVVCT